MQIQHREASFVRHVYHRLGQLWDGWATAIPVSCRQRPRLNTQSGLVMLSVAHVPLFFEGPLACTDYLLCGACTVWTSMRGF